MVLVRWDIAEHLLKRMKPRVYGPGFFVQGL